MNQADIPFLSAAELSRLIERVEVSPVEATTAYLDRIDSLDFKFNSYLTVSRVGALSAAREAERAILQGNYQGPMHGIPVAVKDQIWAKGVRCTGGSRILADFIPDEDATSVANLKKAGAVLLGKTNLSEFATAPSHRYSTPRNPWNLDAHAGASSSGSGAATASFLCATSLGEDTGGSIRNPATYCGLVGLRPSWGRVSRHGVMRGVWSMDAVGPISRSVEDAAITLQAIAGHDPKDPYSWKTDVPDYRKALDGNIRGIRVGSIKEQIDDENVVPEVTEAITNAVAVLAGLGASVEEVSIPATRYGSVIMWILLAVEAASDHREWIKDRLGEYGRYNRRRFLAGSIIRAQAYYKAQKLRNILRRQVLEALQHYDVLLLPTKPGPAGRIEDDPIIDTKQSARLPNDPGPIFSSAGCPAISVPCGLSSQRLPLGLQLAGRPGGEETLLRVAHAYEQSTPWHTMRPPAA